MPTLDSQDGPAPAGPFQGQPRPRQGSGELLEFLQMDPETGETSVYIFDGEFARPACGEELLYRGLDDRMCDIPAVARGGDLDLPVAQAAPVIGDAADEDFDGLDDLVEQFARRYERAYG